MEQIAEWGYEFESVELMKDRPHRMKKIYRVRLKDGGSIRLDVTDTPQPWWEYQRILKRENVMVATELSVHRYEGKFYRFTEYIHGERLLVYWEFPPMFERLGALCSQVNRVGIGRDDLYLFNLDVTWINFVLSNSGELFMIDMDGVIAIDKRAIDDYMVRLLKKNFFDQKYIDSFLNGYQKYRSASIIRRELANANYKISA